MVFVYYTNIKHLSRDKEEKIFNGLVNYAWRGFGFLMLSMFVENSQVYNITKWM